MPWLIMWSTAPFKPFGFKAKSPSMTIGEQRVEREHRDFDREAEREGEEQEDFERRRHALREHGAERLHEDDVERACAVRFRRRKRARDERRRLAIARERVRRRLRD